jgi:putative effector of murein hydrolase
MRKLFAVLATIATLFVIKEIFYINYSTDTEIIKQKDSLLITFISIAIPLFVLSFWLWIPKRTSEDKKL